MILQAHSYFSLKYGVLSQEELLQEAQKKGIKALALTDINTTSGILDFFRLAPHYQIQAIAGIDFRNGAKKCYTGIAKNAEGFNELNIFLSQYLACGAPFPERAPRFENAAVIYPFSVFTAVQTGSNESRLISHSRKSTVSSFQPNELLQHNEYIGISAKDLFTLQFSPLRFQTEKLLVQAPVTFRNKADFNTHRLLRAIDKNVLLSKLEVEQQAAPDEIMHSIHDLKNLFKDFPKLIFNTEKLLEECRIDFEFKKSKNRKYYTSSAKDDYDLLLKLCDENLSYRYPVQSDVLKARFNKEINAITTQGYTSYFLINWDIVRYAQFKNYYYVGRGSGANSLVAYLLRITDVDPIDLDLYFERFINASRTSPPDFDLDFSWNDRDDVTDYIFHRSSYGNKKVALLATYNTFQRDSVVRELGKVFGLPAGEIDALQSRKCVDEKQDSIAKLIFTYSNRMHDLPNYLSVHAGGIVISEKPITYYTALDNPPKGYPLTQFSMLEAEDVGLYKFDILSQRGLGKMKDAVTIVKQNQHIDIDIHQVSQFKTDERVRKNLQEANLIGCFYVESPAMRMLLRKLRASTYLDLVAASSIIRPGVAQSGMMREYILRFHDETRRTYIHPMMKELMAETFGVMVYQEDVIKVAHHFAKLSLTEADMLRRGMSGKYRGREEFKKVEEKFFTNCKAAGHNDEVTKEVWRQIESFAGYAFSKGHSASYAVESYQCMYLKTYFPLEYMVAVLNNGGGFYSTEFYVHEARMCGANIHAPDINRSVKAATIYGKDIYLGLSMIHELEEKTVVAVLNERTSKGPFTSLENFMMRVFISVEQLRLLIRSNAFRFTLRSKQQLLWDIHTLLGSQKKTGFEHEIFAVERKHFELPELYYTAVDDAWDELELLGFPLGSPFDLLKEEHTAAAVESKLEKDTIGLPANSKGAIKAQLIAPFQKQTKRLNFASEFPKHLGKVISIVGYMVTRKHARTKRGEEMAFGTFLDKKGRWIDTTHFPAVLKQFPFAGRACYLLSGKIVEEFGFYSMDVMEMKRLHFVERFASGK